MFARIVAAIVDERLRRKVDSPIVSAERGQWIRRLPAEALHKHDEQDPWRFRSPFMAPATEAREPGPFQNWAEF